MLNNTLSFCPNCGKQSLIWKEEKKWNCKDCDFLLYQNIAAAVAVLLIYEDQILLTRRNKDPKINFWDLPGGFTDAKESGEQTCSRELMEELKIMTNPTDYQYLGSRPNRYQYREIQYLTLDLFFRYDIPKKPELTLQQSEISETIWMKTSEINLDEIAFDSQKDFLKYYFQLT